MSAAKMWRFSREDITLGTRLFLLGRRSGREPGGASITAPQRRHPLRQKISDLLRFRHSNGFRTNPNRSRTQSHETLVSSQKAQNALTKISRKRFSVEVAAEVARMQTNLRGDLVAASSAPRDFGPDHRRVRWIQRHAIPLRIDCAFFHEVAPSIETLTGRVQENNAIPDDGFVIAPAGPALGSSSSLSGG